MRQNPSNIKTVERENYLHQASEMCWRGCIYFVGQRESFDRPTARAVGAQSLTRNTQHGISSLA
jgi:hypothetical protein